MSATRCQMLIQAQRNLDMADELAEEGDFIGAARNAAAAKALIFPARSTTQPPGYTGVTRPAAGSRNPGTYTRNRTK